MEHLPYGLLLETVYGHKKHKAFRAGHVSFSFFKQKVPKGTLLITLSYEESRAIAGHFKPLHNYKSMTDFKITLYCNVHQVYQITREQRDMLHGIGRLEDRVKVLDKLDWMVRLNLGSVIYVTIPSVPVPVRGMIRHIGRLNGEMGTMFGVEMLVCCHLYINVPTVYYCVVV